MTLIKSMTGYGRAVETVMGIYCGATGSEQPIFGLHRQTAPEPDLLQRTG